MGSASCSTELVDAVGGDCGASMERAGNSSLGPKKRFPKERSFGFFLSSFRMLRSSVIFILQSPGIESTEVSVKLNRGS